MGKYSERCEAEGIIFILLVVDRFGGGHKDSLEIKLKTILFHSKIIFRQLMITTSSWSKLASSTSSAPPQVHQDGGNPLNIVSLHCLTFLYYYLLIPPALLITILFHVCPRGLVSFRVEEGGN